MQQRLCVIAVSPLTKDAIELLGYVALRNDAFETAARRLAAAEASRASIGAKRFAVYVEAHMAATAELRHALGEELERA